MPDPSSPSTAPVPARPPRAVRTKTRKEEAEKKPHSREKKARRKQLMVNWGLAVVFGLSSVAFFSMGSYNNIPGDRPAASATPQADAAAAELKNAQNRVASSPNDSDAWFDLGEVFYKQAKWPDAADAYRHALDRDPKNVLAMSHLGTVLLNQGKTSDAIPMLEKARDTETAQLAATKATASPDAEGGDPVESVQDINIPERLYQAYTITKQRDKAKAEFAKATDIDLMHTVQFALMQSEQSFVEDQNKELARSYCVDGTTAAAHLADKLKDELYPRMMIMAIYAGMDRTHPEREPRMKEWLKLLATCLDENDPIKGKKYADQIRKITAPPPPHPSPAGSAGAKSGAASSAPTGAPAIVSSASPGSAAPQK